MGLGEAGGDVLWYLSPASKFRKQMTAVVEVHSSAARHSAAAERSSATCWSCNLAIHSPNTVSDLKTSW